MRKVLTDTTALLEDLLHGGQNRRTGWIKFKVNVNPLREIFGSKWVNRWIIR